MNALVTRADALHALAVAPFVIVCVLLIAAAVWLAVQEERTDYLAPWADREPGAIGGGRDE